MARCNCGGSCGCALTAGDGVTVGGTGSPGNPWVVSANPASCSTVRACLSGGEGISYDDATGVIAADVEAGCGLTGAGTAVDPIRAVVVPWGFPCDITARSSNIYCNPATGELRGEPRARTYTNYQVQEHTPANLPVPAGAVLVPIDTFNFSHTNPDQCRTMRLIVWADTDIDFSLPVGATAGFGIEGDRIVALSNQGASQISNQHFQVPRKVVDVNVAPGATHNYTLTVSGERGAAGASYSRIQMQVNAIFEQN